MSSQSANIDIEPVIWARLMQSQQRDISPETARYLLSIEFGETDRRRIEYLAGQSESGALTSYEQAEFDGYLHVGNLLALMQSKARVVLGAKLRDTSRT